MSEYVKSIEVERDDKGVASNHREDATSRNTYIQYQTVISANKNDGFCVSSLVCGLVGLIFFWWPVLGITGGVLGLILGLAGISKVNRDSTLAGKGMAVAGLALGSAALFFSIILLAWALFLETG